MCKIERKNKMKVVHSFLLKMCVVHDIDNLEGLKGANEYAENVAQFVCDEVTQSNGVASYEIIESNVDVTNDNENSHKFYAKRFTTVH